jgi:glutamate-1-semialdehyde 2,1-aminomutase
MPTPNSFAAGDPMSLRDRYEGQYASSEKLFARAEGVIPGGITHDGRFMRPFPPYIARALGSRKWDVDGREYVDYWMGHGALILGHGHPGTVKAIRAQAGDGLHYGGNHELEVQWAELICRLVPCAGKVRFTNSGSEAVHLATRLARAFTGKKKVVKFAGHFHGWHDTLLIGVDPPFDTPPTIGLPEETSQNVLLCPQNDAGALASLLARDDVGAVILEPSGASFGMLPIRPEFVTEVRRQTRERGIVLIFDEVVTGFRYAVGGAQQYYGVTPEMATFGKIVSGGLTAGAVVGRTDIMDQLAHTADARRNRYGRVAHRGTFSASPIVAAAGIATLEAIADGKAIADANARGAALRDGLNDVIDRQGLPMAAYGDVSSFHLCLDHHGMVSSARQFDALTADPAALKGAKAETVHAFRMAMLLHGVDTMRQSGLLSCAHTSDDADRTLDAFGKALSALKDEKLIG